MDTEKNTSQAPEGQAELSAGLKAAANLIGDVRGLIIFAREHADISVDSLLATWIKQAPEHVRAVNCHDELVAALQAIQAGFRDGSIKWAKPRQSDSDPYHPANTMMCAALAKAEGRA